MRKIFTLKKSLFMVAMLFMSVGAQAQISFKYLPVWGQLKAYPVSGGMVYAEMVTNGSAPEGSNFSEPAAQVDVKFAFRNLASQKYGNFRAVAVPNEAWQFAGFATQQYEDGDPVVPTAVEWTDNPRSIRVTSQVYSSSDFETAAEAFENFPEEADEVFYALFTRVTVGVDAFNKNMGSVEIDEVVNDIGQKVTLTATPVEAGNAQFLYWIEESTGNQISENPYTFEVSGPENYTAVFTSDNVFTIDFPEEGGYVEFYKSENEVYFPETVERPVFMLENVKKFDEKNGFFSEVDNYRTSIMAQTPTFFYAKGTQRFLDDPTSTKPGGFYMDTPSEFWGGDEGVKLDTMKVSVEIGWETEEFGDVSGYLFDKEINAFKRIEDGMAPAGRVFLAFPQYTFDQLEEGYVPDVIYLTEEEAKTASVGTIKANEPVKNGKTYTIDGKQVAAPAQKGVYIYDGKKLIVK